MSSLLASCLPAMLSEDDTLFVATDNVYDTRLLLQRLKRIVKA